MAFNQIHTYSFKLTQLQKRDFISKNNYSPKKHFNYDILIAAKASENKCILLKYCQLKKSLIFGKYFQDS